MRILTSLFVMLSLWAGAASAQNADSVFRDYAAYADFVDQHIKQRRFVPLIQRLGGRDEYTEEQLQSNQRQMENVWPSDFENVTVFRQTDLGGGVTQEGRIYWTGTSYAFYYALLHQRADDLVVLNFTVNSNANAVIEKF